MEEFHLDQRKVKQAVIALKELNDNFVKDASKKKQLLDEESEGTILLQITLKKIPLQKLIQMIKVPLPYPLIKDTTEICLITGDLDKKDQKAEIEPTVLHYKELLKRQGINNISEVIPLRQLRTEYKNYEAKRQLVGAYDVFLADNKIAGVLPKLLGKFFFKKRKFPSQINLQSPNLKHQVDKALTNTTFFLTGRGNSCTAEIGHLGLQNKQIIKNISATIEMLIHKIPGTWENILGLYLKMPRSLALPIYLSFDNPNNVKLDMIKKIEEVEAEEITTINNLKVKVFSDGRVKVIKDEIGNDSEDDSDEETSKGSPQKKLKTNLEENDMESISESESSLPVESSKSKKRQIHTVKKENKSPKMESKVEHKAQQQSSSVSKKQKRNKIKKENVAVEGSVTVIEPKQVDEFETAELNLVPSIGRKVKHSLITKQNKLELQMLSAQKQPKEKKICLKKETALEQTKSFVNVIEAKQVDGCESAAFKVMEPSTKRKVKHSLNRSLPVAKQKKLEIQVISDQMELRERKTAAKQKSTALKGRTRSATAKK